MKYFSYILLLGKDVLFISNIVMFFASLFMLNFFLLNSIFYTENRGLRILKQCKVVGLFSRKIIKQKTKKINHQKKDKFNFASHSLHLKNKSLFSKNCRNRIYIFFTFYS